MKNCEYINCSIEHDNKRSKYCCDEHRLAQANYNRIQRLNKKFEDLQEGLDYLICPECGQKVAEITGNHAKMHGLTIDEFKIKHEWNYVQCEKKRQKHIENNPFKGHGGKLSPFSKKNKNYDPEWHKKFSEKHSEFQKNNENNPFCREAYNSDEEYKRSQAKFTLEKCIERHGKERGQEIWKDRQNRWQETLTLKSQEEIYSINKRKVQFSGYSKISQDLFDAIGIKKSRYATNGGEYRVKLGKGKHVSLDYMVGNKVIEFNGDKWHANPKIYSRDDKITINKRFKNVCPEEIWEKDADRIKEIESLGYEVMIVWESEYKKSKKEIIEKCLEFLKK